MSGKKKGKKKNPQPARAMVRISQCMIVKNEEKNIERALTWAKGIVIEQIVVDTGSTDRTVEIATKMGAKVYHFPWIDDFSAAKNYAIEQASGNWIAFLDADEYLSPADTKEVPVILKRIMSNPELKKNWLVLHSALANLNDEGKPTSIIEQARFFRNLPGLRYVGKIHEVLNAPVENTVRTDDITILHTGYAQKVYAETGKLGRNVDMLRAQLAERPDDYSLKAYLADSLEALGDEESLAEAEILFAEVAEYGTDILPALRKSTYTFLINRYTRTERIEPADAMSLKALEELPDDIDLLYLRGVLLSKSDKHAEAWKFLKRCEARLANTAVLEASEFVAGHPVMLFGHLAFAAQKLGDEENLVRYATMTLAEDKTETGVLAPYIFTLLKNDASEDDVLGILGKIFDLNEPRDLLAIARGAKDCGAMDFANRVIKMGQALNK
jgi:glycosyltransferase involved in cell wall biosynthesis